MYPVKRSFAAIAANVLLVTGSFALQSEASAATATYDPSTRIVDIPKVDVLNPNGGAKTYHAQLKLLEKNPASPFFELQLISAGAETPTTEQRVTYDGATISVHFPSVKVGAGAAEYYAKLKLIPGSNPLRFKLVQLKNNAFSGCPAFSTNGPVAGTCVLSGEINNNITLSKEITWILSGGVYVGGDQVNSATLSINPGTKIVGQSGADYLYIRRGSKILAEGTPDNPIVMTGPFQESAGEWGGLLLAGNAPVNGCSEGVDPCEIAFEAIATELFGGNDVDDNSGVLKYLQVNYAGFAVRPDEELNGITMLGVGAGTLVDYVQVHKGLDDGIEMFGSTVQMKHLVLTSAGDDSLDWGIGWRGKAQFVLIKQAVDDGDRGIEADNNPDNNDASPRSKPILSNLTALGSPVSSQGALLRRGTGASIYNSVFTGFGEQCLRIDGTPTYTNAGTPEALSGELTIQDSYVDCDTNFNDEGEEPFLVSDWFNAQSGNVAGDPILDGYLPGVGSPLITGGHDVPDAFFTPVDYIGAFKDANDDWTQEWTTPF